MKLILTIAAIFIGNSVFCQNCFEGKVVYNHIMKGIGNSNTTEEVYYRKDGSFVSIHKEQSMKMIYRADNGTIYNIHKLNGKIVIMFDLSYIMPICTGIVQIATLIASKLVFKETIGMQGIIGASIVIIGIIIMNLPQNITT